MMANSTVEFITTDFELAHGHKPAGRGSWAFAPTNFPTDADIIWVNGLYSEAKKTALAIAQQRGFETIYVLS